MHGFLENEKREVDRWKASMLPTLSMEADSRSSSKPKDFDTPHCITYLFFWLGGI